MLVRGSWRAELGEHNSGVGGIGGAGGDESKELDGAARDGNDDTSG